MCCVPGSTVANGTSPGLALRPTQPDVTAFFELALKIQVYSAFAFGMEMQIVSLALSEVCV